MFGEKCHECKCATCSNNQCAVKNCIACRKRRFGDLLEVYPTLVCTRYTTRDQEDK